MTGNIFMLHNIFSCTLFLILLFLNINVNAKSFSIEEHTIDIGARPRLAYIDTSNHGKSASILIRLKAKSEWTPALSTFLEIDHVQLGFKHYFTNGVNFNGRPVIPDVAGTDLNQLYIQYSLSNSTNIIAGREVINIGNERFIGSNSFWQNEQSFDTAGIDYTFSTASSLMYRYVNNANRINGEEATAFLKPSDSNFDTANGLRPANFLGDHTHDTHLLFTNIKESDHSTFQAYYYDIKIKEAAALSNRVLGARYEYKSRWGSYKTSAHADFAVQRRPELTDSKQYNYYNVGVGLGFKTRDLALQYEVLGENEGASFVTPLSSLHDNNGWADKFLATPKDGLRDLSGKLVWRISPVKIDLRYHIFSSDSTGNVIGKELDVDFSFKFSHKNSLLMRFADFKSNNLSFNTEKRIFIQHFYNL